APVQHTVARNRFQIFQFSISRATWRHSHGSAPRWLSNTVEYTLPAPGSVRVLSGLTRVHFPIHIVGRERPAVGGDRTKPICTGGTETHLCLRRDRLAVNNRV